MGLTAIPVNNHSFNLNLLAYLSVIEPDLKIYSWIEPGQESSFLNSICDRGFAIEVGPITPGILDATLFQSTERLIHAILDYLHGLNQGNTLHYPASLLIYRHLSTVDFPKRDTGELNGMIHRDRQEQDYQELRPGDPLFTTFDGEAIVYTGSSSVYPVFINEAAYYEKGIAMCLTQKETIDITSLHP
jgi:aspartoacylase